jgi:type III secretory pathway component EscU
MNCSFKWRKFLKSSVETIKEIIKIAIFTILIILALSIIFAGIGYIAVHLFGITIATQASSSFGYYKDIGIIIILLYILIMVIKEIKQSFTICKEDEEQKEVEEI